MKIHVADNLADFPQVQWYEQRLHLGFFWNSTRVYKAHCGIAYLAKENTFEFYHWHASHKYMINVPFDIIQGFGLATSTELHQRGDTAMPSKSPEYTYRDPLVLYAQYSKPSNGNMILPLTFTSATRAEVMGLHGILTQVFIVDRLSLQNAARAVVRDTMSQHEAKKRAALIGEPFGFAGRRFVPLRSLGEPEIKPGEDPLAGEASLPEEWNIPEPYFDLQRRFTKIGVLSFADLVRRGDKLFKPGKIVSFFDSTAREKADMIHVALLSEKEIWEAHKPYAELKDVVVLSGDDIAIPPIYLPFPDVLIDRSTRVLCIEFHDGTILPLTQSAPELALDFQQVRDGLLSLARGGIGPRTEMKL